MRRVFDESVIRAPDGPGVRRPCDDVEGSINPTRPPIKAEVHILLASSRSSLHAYIAIMEGVAGYGWGHTGPEARECLAAMLQREARVSALDRKYRCGRRIGAANALTNSEKPMTQQLQLVVSVRRRILSQSVP